MINALRHFGWEVSGLVKSSTFRKKGNDSYLGASSVLDSIQRMRRRNSNFLTIWKNSDILKAVGEEGDTDLLAELVVQANGEGLPIEPNNESYDTISKSFNIPKKLAKEVVMADKLLSYIKELNLTDEDIDMMSKYSKAITELDPNTNSPLDADTIADKLGIPLQNILNIRSAIEGFQKKYSKLIQDIQASDEIIDEDQTLQKPFTVNTGEETKNEKVTSKRKNVSKEQPNTTATAQ